MLINPMLLWNHSDPQRELIVELYKIQPESPIDFESVLSQKECERLASISNASYRQLFLQSRFYLKKHLESYLGLKGSDISMTFVGEGKPVLQSQSQMIDFSLSHKDNYFALAISKKVLVGLDIEVNHHRTYQEKLALRFMSSSEIQEIQESKESSEEFLRLWSLKEAIVKLKAGGMFKHASEVIVSLKGPQIKKWPESYGDQSTLKLESFNGPHNIFLSIATVDR